MLPAKGKGKITPGKVTDSDMSKAEQMFSEMIKSGKVKSITKARKEVAKKTGVWPNGMTN